MLGLIHQNRIHLVTIFKALANENRMAIFDLIRHGFHDGRTKYGHAPINADIKVKGHNVWLIESIPRRLKMVEETGLNDRSYSFAKTTTL